MATDRSTAPEPFDHGILNVPIAKRGHGSIEAQIDRWKVDQRRAAKVEARAAHERRLESQAVARELIARIDVIPKDHAALGRLAARLSVTITEARKELRFQAKMRPDTVRRWLDANAPPSGDAG